MTDRSFIHMAGDVGFLLIHGLGGTPVELRFIATGLARAGHTVHCCQLPGHCGSEADLVATTWQQWHVEVASCYRQLRRRCRKVIVGGLSMGAILALNVAAEETPPDGLALYAPTLWLDGWGVPWYSFLIRVLKDTPIRHLAYVTERPPYGIKSERLREIIVSQMTSGDAAEAGSWRTPGEALRQFTDLVDHVEPKLGRITAPALVFHPRHDDMASLSNAVHIQRRLGGLVECVVLDDSYHMITIDQQRHIVLDRSLEFAARIEAFVPQAARRRPALVERGSLPGAAA